MHYHTSKSGDEMISLKENDDRMKKGQNDIYCTKDELEELKAEVEPLTKLGDKVEQEVILSRMADLVYDLVAERLKTGYAASRAWLKQAIAELVGEMVEEWNTIHVSELDENGTVTTAVTTEGQIVAAAPCLLSVPRLAPPPRNEASNRKRHGRQLAREHP